jgi:hypothetical protein
LPYDGASVRTLRTVNPAKSTVTRQRAMLRYGIDDARKIDVASVA